MIPQSSNSDNDLSSDLGVVVLEDKPELKEPPLYQVVLLNDDFTPMDFVIYILQSIFGYEHERSTQIMLAVHSKGKGVCGIFPKEIAEMKSHEINQLARAHEHPLVSDIEPLTD
ncbi:MAG: ATP-dependent Clp protease adaptor ClpS [SAR86 cluster bacterium BACL1 MAG-120920-bin57]|jgi:ATP-dependent Clp protease adaptor protein ClpS|uniref:ATP-dependent Clp protease adapter protein ClpS n=2 Tax=SAR86 cluster TaxID=62672 RepID=A0A0R2U8B9_9GAMM|nr:MAG: ATP-dependent Clp protease adaptor ClpS [SAR86 cluster bacterium BACL1 MAG-120507-bin14]KRO40316.1 MAG: ATP-dependent Clp protease adaptor ClpS [SAR86 cluster bacterium BACL1 MAG-120920-bin57]KRO95390.1 MAG: ATP-dependent Clp protease adaptor ClpS [SAR86 cluster bacterium BACL1 MAG-120828-bin5]KRO95769.1 MAG: ATP-dependent Clp protease adaptor ClpS [SAR86 cluster bacterium BACL1 MAG-120820-bin45]KRO98167.1 MAG: ATP-dependent Clp protease adaptor ClpS [SAR86 cluster bacterium BACL1 MAG-1